MKAVVERDPPAARLAVPLDLMRAFQARWASVPLRQRLKWVRELRALISDHALTLARASASSRRRPVAEVMTAEVFPLAEACAFLEREAETVLAPRRVGAWSQPLWLSGVRSEVVREPLGVVLIVGPGNYPLMLAGIQLVQALVAGNAVLLKPGEGGTAAAQALVRLVVEAGVDRGLIGILPEDPVAFEAAIEAGPDLVVFTGSTEVGRQVLSGSAPRLIPSVMELGGCDAMIVREDADLELVVAALRFALSLNSGETCMAPKRILVHAAVARSLEEALRRTFAEARPLSSAQCRRAADRVREALDGGARLLAGHVGPGDTLEGPLILADVGRENRLMEEGVFAPVVAMTRVGGDDEALALANGCDYRLGASVFSRDEVRARALAERVRAGVVTINDVVVPTASGSLPFGGRGQSGFGVTRGAEGLLQLTVPKVVTWSRSSFRPAYDSLEEGDERMFHAYLRCAHGRGFGERVRGLLACVKHLVMRRRQSGDL